MEFGSSLYNNNNNKKKKKKKKKKKTKNSIQFNNNFSNTKYTRSMDKVGNKKQENRQSLLFACSAYSVTLKL
jgi:hypothetical protein